MKKILAMMILAPVVFVSACANSNTTSTDSRIEGGSDSKVRGEYLFNGNDEYLSFYELFKDHNEERYLLPAVDENRFNINYTFVSEGVLLGDYQNQNYSIKFDNQSLFCSISLKDETSEFLLEAKMFSFFEVISGDEIVFNCLKENEHYLYIVTIGNYVLLNAVITTNMIGNELSTIVDEISDSLIGGINYVY